jgi:hypothetical protein
MLYYSVSPITVWLRRTIIVPRLDYKCIKNNHYLYYYALTKYTTLVGKGDMLPSGTKNKR